MSDVEQWIKCASEAELRTEKSIARMIGAQEITILIVGEHIVAIQRKCPHEGANLDEGQIYAGKVIKCPLHGFIFDLASGKGLNCPTLHISTYPTKIENGEVFVKTA